MSVDPIPTVPTIEVSSFIHTPCYCEENVYMLCKKLCLNGLADENGSDLFVVFISNEMKQVPIWCQKAGKNSDGLVIWDYHVICIQLQKDTAIQVWDLDSNLSLPVSLRRYKEEAIRSSIPLNAGYNRLFRVVHAPMFLHYFSSDRRHMRDTMGRWMACPPQYEPIVAKDGTINNLNDYIRMSSEDVASNMKDLVDAVFSLKHGVVLSDEQLVGFFLMIRTSLFQVT